MFRKHVPDLDLLESPLISANPFGSILGVVPGSALAERIFNDPGSWQDTEDDEEEESTETKEAMAWLTEEVERYHSNGDELALSPIDRDVDIMLKPFTERFKLVSTSGSKHQVNWEGVVQQEKPPLLPLFDHKSLDLNFDLRMSKIWDSGGKMFRSFPSPLSPVNEPSVNNNAAPPPTTETPRLAVPPALNLDSVEGALSPILSPVAVASASTTWSILEWYGAPPTPRMSGRAPLLGHYPATPFHPIPPVPQIPPSSLRTPSSPSINATVASKPPSLPNPPRKATPPATDSTPLRRLPIIPDPARSSPSPTPASTPPRVKSPERTPRGSATLPPPPSSSASDPFYLSPNATPIRSGTLPSRSPPAGPRPRSGNQSMRRTASGRDSPSPITIAPAPTRTRRPTPPPALRLGVPA
ncbi:hypothetical protein FPV67DRAFT_248571 [Lyophyllum atratum]|nr:hypothetical protein FPV67DRAFT_248571 [Lyophyllum atratum]